MTYANQQWVGNGKSISVCFHFAFVLRAHPCVPKIAPRAPSTCPTNLVGETGSDVTPRHPGCRATVSSVQATPLPDVTCFSTRAPFGEIWVFLESHSQVL
ncbi:hypothetical protein AVEN_213562-1 [Araneus ventricosus]|uniref:Uncharacterized protein n=1 Tax=Araneus ventricosus TaxID=182803 RepID=A0A4Y2JJW1_ARAVE|nr:hypothetical protein AVEN_213562-1 [Araneus ventricosus]